MAPQEDQAAKLRSFYAQSSVCVTGGAGFIGGRLVERLLDLDARVVVIDDLSNSDGRWLATQVERNPGRLRFVYGSILDPDALRDALEGARVVFHQAAMGSVPRSIEDPERCIDVNALGTLRVAQGARSADAHALVYASSSSVYGNASDPDRPRVEDDPIDALSPYAASKAAGEHVARAWAQSMQLRAVSLRYFNVFGPHQPANSAYAAVIPAFISALDAGETPTIFGDGSFSRDFTAVHNVVCANLLAGAAPVDALDGRAVNVGCGVRTTILELFQRIARLMGRPDAQPEFAPPRAGDVPHSLADLTRVREAIGYEPLVDLDAGLARTIEHMTGRRPPGADPADVVSKCV